MKERTLDLVLKGCWYDLIKRGVKREEYREIKPYWEKRLLDYKSIVRNLEAIKFKQIILGKRIDFCKEYPKGYTQVRFRRGYTQESMTFRIDSITIGLGKSELGAPQEEVFIIKFSEI